jgi:hypothetical protein
MFPYDHIISHERDDCEISQSIEQQSSPTQVHKTWHASNAPSKFIGFKKPNQAPELGPTQKASQNCNKFPDRTIKIILSNPVKPKDAFV